MTNQTQDQIPTLETAFQQAKELNEQFLKSARQAGNLYLESYEWAVDRTLDFEHKVADLSQQEWLKDVIEAQADITRDLSASYATTLRSLIK